MDYETFAKKHFNGNASAFARAFNLTPGAVQYWKRHGIPPLRQAQLELWLLKKKQTRKNQRSGQRSAAFSSESS